MCLCPALPCQGLLVTVNGNPVDYHTIHPSLPIENGPAKADLYSTPQYRWEPSEDSSGKEPSLLLLPPLRHPLGVSLCPIVYCVGSIFLTKALSSMVSIMQLISFRSVFCPSILQWVVYPSIQNKWYNWSKF